MQNGAYLLVDVILTHYAIFFLRRINLICPQILLSYTLFKMLIYLHFKIICKKKDQRLFSSHTALLFNKFNKLIQFKIYILEYEIKYNLDFIDFFSIWDLDLKIGNWVWIILVLRWFNINFLSTSNSTNKANYKLVL